MPFDATAPEHATTVTDRPAEAERDYFCARCGALVTKGRWEIAPDGEHERTFFNPAGILFRVLCFRDAPGAFAVGSATTEFSWFKCYAWRLAGCRGCGAHLGWRFEGAQEPPIFFGLIKSALTHKAG